MFDLQRGGEDIFKERKNKEEDAVRSFLSIITRRYPNPYTLISDCNAHNTVAAYTFLKPILNYVKQLCPSLKIVHYFTEGAASQYKNYKNIANLLHHLDDFQLVAEWHFFATSHGLLATCHPYFPFDCDVAQSFYFSLGIFVFTVSNH